MRKGLMIGGGAVVLAALGWTGLWFAGRGVVEAQLDAELARLGDQGYAVTTGARQIGGFPLGYEVTLQDLALAQPAAHTRADLPRLVASATVWEPRALTLRLPETAALHYDPSAEARAAEPNLPPSLTLALTSQDWVAVIRPQDTGGRRIESTAKAIRVVTTGTAAGAIFDVGLRDLVQATDVPATPGTGPTASTAQAELIDYRITTQDPAAGTTTVTGSYAAARITSTSTLDNSTDLAAVIRALGTVALDFAYTTGPARFEMTQAGGPDGADGSLSVESAESSGRFVLAAGGLEITGGSGAQVLRMAAADPTSPLRGTAQIARSDAVLRLPIAQTDDMRPLGLGLTLEGVTLDDAVWAQIDPGAALDRAPARLRLDLSGTARMTRAFDAPDPDDLLPFELGPLTVRAVELGLLGAEATVSGEIVFDGPEMVPAGTLTLRTRRGLAALDQAVMAGLVPPDTAAFAGAMAQVYAQPGAEPDSLVSEIVFDALGGITVNGQPVQ